jgi:hypothetical protein
MVAEDGVACSEGACLAGGCGQVGALACTAQAIRDAVAQGGGPHFFACDEATPVVLAEEILIDNDVILDGEGELFVVSDGVAFSVEPEPTVEIRAIHVEPGPHPFSIYSRGTLTLSDSVVQGVLSYEANLTLIDTEVRVTGVVNSVGEATLTRCRILGTGAIFADAGLDNHGGLMTVRDSVISGWGFGEWPSHSGAVHNTHIYGPQGFSDGVLTIENTTISGNRGYRAGALYNNDGIVTLINSTVSDNIAVRGPSIHTHTIDARELTLINSTVSGATVEYQCGSESNGFGIENDGMLTITNSTIAGNAAGALDNRDQATVTNSVLDGDCAQFGDDAATMSGGYNIVGGTDACGFDDPTDLVDVSSAALALGPLSDNGGPTMTHALLQGSVAIDTIPGAMCEVDEDQRGEPRPAGGMCDVGAFEVQP